MPKKTTTQKMLDNAKKRLRKAKEHGDTFDEKRWATVVRELEGEVSE